MFYLTNNRKRALLAIVILLDIIFFQYTAFETRSAGAQPDDQIIVYSPTECQPIPCYLVTFETVHCNSVTYSNHMQIEELIQRNPKKFLSHYYWRKMKVTINGLALSNEGFDAEFVPVKCSPNAEVINKRLVLITSGDLRSLFYPTEEKSDCSKFVGKKTTMFMFNHNCCQNFPSQRKCGLQIIDVPSFLVSSNSSSEVEK